jgi:hypothetical protein
VGNVSGDQRFGDIVQPRDGNVLPASAQCGKSTFQGRMAQYVFQAFAYSREDHAS